MKRTVSILLCFAVAFAAMLAIPLPTLAAETENTVRYGKSTITNENIAYVYSLFESEIRDSKTPESIEVSEEKGVTSEEVHSAFVLFKSDYPECFWLGQSYAYSTVNANVVEITPEYVFTGSELTDAVSALEGAVSDILRGMPDTGNYEKSLYLHDTIANLVTYEHVGQHQTAYGALVAGKAVCAGYAAAYQLLLNRAGIPAWTVTGESNKPGSSTPIAHAWNIVWLEDDVCVYSDVTWDDGNDKIFHYYLNISKDEMERDHTTDEDIILPECNHNDKSYFDVNNHSVNDSTTIEELALLFGPAKDNSKTAVLYYQGSDIEGFLQNISNNMSELYQALSGRPGTIQYTSTYISGEIHITLSGNFEKETYLVNINYGETLKCYGTATQYTVIGEEITPTRLTAADGYYFPEEYTVDNFNGITVSRISESEILISGIPTNDTDITLPAAAEKPITEPENPSPETPEPEVPDPEFPDPEVPDPESPDKSEFSAFVDEISIRVGNKAEFAAIKQAFILYEGLSDEERAQDAEAYEKLTKLAEDYNVLAIGHNEKISQASQFSAKSFSITSIALAAVLFLLKKLYIGG